MNTTEPTLKPNLMVVKASIPMWSNEQIQMEIDELNQYIIDLKIDEQDTSYYEQKKELLENVLKARV